MPLPGVVAHDWQLEAQAEPAVVALAAWLRGEGVTRVVTSTEPKAVQTGRVLARELGVAQRSAPGLHEQSRRHAPFFARPADFQAAVRELFERPAERVFGEESADEAHARFLAAVRDAMNAESGNVVIVAHGTVNSLLVARANQVNAVEYWQSLGMPHLTTLQWPSLRLLRDVRPAGAAPNPG